MNTHDEKQVAAFLEGGAEIDGYRLQKPTAGRVALLESWGNALVAGGDDLEDKDMLWHLGEGMFVMVHDDETLARLTILGADEARMKARAWVMGLDSSTIEAFGTWWGDQAEQLEATAAEVVDEPGKTDPA